MAAPEEAKSPEEKMHIKDLYLNDRQRREAASLRPAILSQIHAVPVLLVEDEPALRNQDPSGFPKQNTDPHQGKREIARRARKIREGKLTGANGLLRRK